MPGDDVGKRSYTERHCGMAGIVRNTNVTLERASSSNLNATQASTTMPLLKQKTGV